MYLKDVWGIPQTFIAEFERINQSQISRIYNAAKIKYGKTNIRETAGVHFSEEEIYYLMQLPREIIADMELVAFVLHVLGLRPRHPFFDVHESNSTQIAALASLGVQNKHLVDIFNKTQPTISMAVKRNLERVKRIERVTRFDYKIPLGLEYERVGTGIVVNKTY